MRTVHKNSWGWMRAGLFYRLMCNVAGVGVLLGPVLAASAQQPFQILLVGVDRRDVMSLDGDWHYLVDQAPARDLYTDTGAINDHGYAMNTHPNISSGPHNGEYDFATAPTLKVPGDWNTQDPRLFNYEGALWYQRDFSVPPTTAHMCG